MATETAPTESQPGSSSGNRRVWIIVAAVVALIVIVGAGIVIYKKTNKSDSKAAFTPAGTVAKHFVVAWKAGDRTAAAKLASNGAVTQAWVLKPESASGLTFGACKKTAKNPFPKACTFTRPGGQVVLTVTRLGKANPEVTAVVEAQAGTPPTSAP
jgi:hypothetical protein